MHGGVHRRRRALVPVLLVLALLIGVLMPGPVRGSGPTWDLSRCVDPMGTSQARLGEGIVIDFSAPPPGYASLSFDQKLDHQATAPSFRGMVLGATGGPQVETIDGRTVVTDFPLRVVAVFGVSTSPYHAGETITLRVPGGCTPGSVTTVEPAPPVVTANEELFVGVGDDVTIFGGNSDNRVIAFPADDVFEVRGGTVHGEGSWSAFSEPLTAFERHFQH